VELASTSRENHALRPRLRDVPPARHADLTINGGQIQQLFLATLGGRERRAERVSPVALSGASRFASDECRESERGEYER
jgi:hypothetical protein